MVSHKLTDQTATVLAGIAEACATSWQVQQVVNAPIRGILNLPRPGVSAWGVLPFESPQVQVHCAIFGGSGSLASNRKCMRHKEPNSPS